MYSLSRLQSSRGILKTMKPKLLIATTNPGKLAEISGFLSDLPLQLVSLRDVGITDDVEETGETYQENAKKKAVFYSLKSGLPALADDGGIEIAALNGKPGVHSKRWVGDDTSDEKIIARMKEVSQKIADDNRAAKFVAVLVLAFPNGKTFSARGEVEGTIAKKPLIKLMHGYPYRSFFYLPKIKKYYHESELTRDEEKLYNHRWKAIQKLIPIIKKELC